eukprot:Clim_evm47s214 gene=Clim_evmTU47s214
MAAPQTMVTRSLTQKFLQRRKILGGNRRKGGFARNHSDVSESAGLVMNEDIGSGSGGRHTAALPPEWYDAMEEVNYQMDNIRKDMSVLSDLFERHASRPDFDDNQREGQEIEIRTREVTNAFHQLQRVIDSIGRGRVWSEEETKVLANMKQGLASNLKSLSMEFRQSQTAYLRALRTREEQNRQFFGGAEDLLAESELGGKAGGPAAAIQYDKGFTEQQLQQLIENSEQISTRDMEITQVARSINELAEIFRDINQMVVEQGTVLDRIDYNLEHVSQHVGDAVVQLEKAENYQKKAAKKFVILALILAILIVLFLILAAAK